MSDNNKLPNEIWLSADGTFEGYYFDTQHAHDDVKYTRATPPKSQGVEVRYPIWECGTCKNRTSGIDPFMYYQNDDGETDEVCRICLSHNEMFEVDKEATRQHPIPAQAQGESADAEIAAIIKAYKSVAKQLGRYPAPTLPDAIQSVEWAMNNTGVIFFNYPDDGYKHAVEVIIKSALSHAPEVVTVEEWKTIRQSSGESMAVWFPNGIRIVSAKNGEKS